MNSHGFGVNAYDPSSWAIRKDVFIPRSPYHQIRKCTHVGIYLIEFFQLLKFFLVMKQRYLNRQNKGFIGDV